MNGATVVDTFPESSLALVRTLEGKTEWIPVTGAEEAGWEEKVKNWAQARNLIIPGEEVSERVGTEAGQEQEQEEEEASVEVKKPSSSSRTVGDGPAAKGCSIESVKSRPGAGQAESPTKSAAEEGQPTSMRELTPVERGSEVTAASKSSGKKSGGFFSKGFLLGGGTKKKKKKKQKKAEEEDQRASSPATVTVSPLSLSAKEAEFNMGSSSSTTRSREEEHTIQGGGQSPPPSPLAAASGAAAEEARTAMFASGDTHKVQSRRDLWTKKAPGGRSNSVDTFSDTSSCSAQSNEDEQEGEAEKGADAGHASDNEEGEEEGEEEEAAAAGGGGELPDEEDDWLAGTSAARLTTKSGAASSKRRKKKGKKGKKGGSQQQQQQQEEEEEQQSSAPVSSVKSPKAAGEGDRQGGAGGAATMSKAAKKRAKRKSKAMGGGGGGGPEEEKDEGYSTEGVSPSSSPSPQAGGQMSRTRSKRKEAVSFGGVREVLLERRVGGCGMPSEGTWALHLGQSVSEVDMTVDEYETAKAHSLESRTEALNKREKKLATGETRQFDYQSGTNPLFYRLDEKERKTLLLGFAAMADRQVQEEEDEEMMYGSGSHDRAEEDEGGGGNGHYPAPLTLSSSLGGGHSSSSSNNNTMMGRLTRGKARSISCCSSDYTRSVSGGGSGLSHSSSVNSGGLHDAFEHDAEVGRKEMEEIRKSRSQAGCNCHPVVLEKLTTAKLKEELRARHIDFKATRKADLVKILAQSLDATGQALCNNNMCECFRSGIGCQADVCGCCKAHRGGGKKSHRCTSGAEMKAAGCGNPDGAYAYSEAVVNEYRSKFITARPVTIPS